MFDYRNIVRNRELRLKIINLLRFIPDKPYLKLVYRIKTGKRLNIESPSGFNEKLNWLKINHIHPEYTDYADKLMVREHIVELLGEGHLFPLIGAWECFDDIPFEQLPEQFVLKCNHDSGSVKIVKNKENIDLTALKQFYDNRLKINSYNIGREYPYRNITPKILAERYVHGIDGKTPNDYKFFCFNGEPMVMFVATDRDTDVTHTLFDMDFNRLPIEYVHKSIDYDMPKPSCFEEMKNIARLLSAGMEFVRIDLYEVDGTVYFGEYTFFPAGGFYLMKPIEWEKRLGDLIEI